MTLLTKYPHLHHTTYQLTVGVIGAPQIISQPAIQEPSIIIIINQFPPFSPVSHCPLGLGKLQACPFPDVVFPPLPLSALSSYPFHCALQDGFRQSS